MAPKNAIQSGSDKWFLLPAAVNGVQAGVRAVVMAVGSMGRINQPVDADGPAGLWTGPKNFTLILGNINDWQGHSEFFSEEDA